MFCPGCGTQNELKQGYCRQCGQALSAVRLAVEGSAGQSLEKLKTSEKWINAGTATLFVFTLIGLGLAFLGFLINEPVFTGITLINLMLGLVIGLPLIYVGKLNLKRATRLLSRSRTESSHSALDQSPQPDELLRTGINADSLRMQPPGSVTEHTTLDLQRSEAVPRRRQENDKT